MCNSSKFFASAEKCSFCVSSWSQGKQQVRVSGSMMTVMIAATLPTLPNFLEIGAVVIKWPASCLLVAPIHFKFFLSFLNVSVLLCFIERILRTRYGPGVANIHIVLLCLTGGEGMEAKQKATKKTKSFVYKQSLFVCETILMLNVITIKFKS